ERGIVGAEAEVVFATPCGPVRGGEMRITDLIGPVASVGAGASLLNARVDGERRAAGEGGDAQQFPARGERVRGSGKGTLEAQVLRRTDGERVGDVEIRWTLLGMIIEGILRGRYGDCSGGPGASGDLAGVVERLRPGVSRLQPGAAMGNDAGERGLQRVVGGVRGIGDHGFDAESTDDLACAVELREGRESRLGAGIAVGVD